MGLLAADATAQTGGRVPWQAKPGSQAAVPSSVAQPIAAPAMTTAPASAMSRRSRATPVSQLTTEVVSGGEGVGESVFDDAPMTGPMVAGPGPVVGPDGLVGPPIDGGCASCGGGGCATCDVGSPWDGAPYDNNPYFGPLESRLWLRTEYLMWWLEESSVGPLVTTSPEGTARTIAGVLGRNTTSILYGNDTLGDESRDGLRVSFGLRPTECSPWGVEASYFKLDDGDEMFHAESEDGLPILARPFNNLQAEAIGDAGAADALLIAYPNVAEGSIDVHSGTRLQGLEVLFRRRFYEQCDSQLDFLVGWRWARLDDELRVDNSITGTGQGGFVPVGTRLTMFDLFESENEFNGGEIGFSYQTQRCRWSMEALMKLAIGSTDTLVSVSGETTTRAGTATDTTPGGLLAQPSNIGQYENDDLTIMPELGVTFGYDITCRLKATFGYTFIYWSQVARSSEQIDFDINPTQFDDGELDGLARPSFPFCMNDFWAQGMNFGLEYKF
jgi:hypothetical protein